MQAMPNQSGDMKKKKMMMRMKAPRAANRKSITGVDISPATRVSLYAQARFLPQDFKQESGLLLPFVTYFQDPFVAKLDPHQAFDEKVFVAWEPGLTDGPTSSRFAIVDYNADTAALEPPAVWDEPTQTFVSTAGKPLGPSAANTFQFHQVSVWALLQCGLRTGRSRLAHLRIGYRSPAAPG